MKQACGGARPGEPFPRCGQLACPGRRRETQLPSLTKEEEQVINRVTARRAIGGQLPQSPCFTEGETEAWRGQPPAHAHTGVGG